MAQFNDVYDTENQSQNQSQNGIGIGIPIESNNGEEEEEEVLKFMDSLHAYLSLLDSLSSTLRQGWFEFASARYSMGTSRLNTALLDLKEHPASTSLELTHTQEPHFTLCKWTNISAGDTNEMKNSDNGSNQECNSLHQRHKNSSHVSEVEEENSSVKGPLATDFDRVQKERSKSLAVFGTLVSPNLRTAQLSFETALETLVHIANVRASMVSSFDQLHKSMAKTRD